MQYFTKWLNTLIKVIGIIFIVTTVTKVNAQEITHLSLEQANQLARQNYPMIKQKDLVKQTANLNIENLNKGFLPQFSISGQASYQSDVTQINIPLPGFKIEPPGKDQYKILADVSQLVYDGGVIKQDIEIGIKKVEAQVQNGIAFKSNLNVLKAKLLKTQQRMIELDASGKGMIETLELFMNMHLKSDVVLEKPVMQSNVSEI